MNVFSLFLSFCDTEKKWVLEGTVTAGTEYQVCTIVQCRPRALACTGRLNLWRARHVTACRRRSPPSFALNHLRHQHPQWESHCHQITGKYDTAALSTMTQSASAGHLSNKSKDTVTGHFQGHLLAAR